MRDGYGYEMYRSGDQREMKREMTRRKWEEMMDGYS